MCELLRLPNAIGVDYPNVADKINELYPDKDELTADALKSKASRLKIDWMKLKKGAQRFHENQDILRPSE